MTDEAIDPLRDLPDGTSPASVREFGTALARGGINIHDINASLIRRGVPALDAGSAEYAHAVRDQILSDPKTRAAILDGSDVTTLTELSMLELHAQKHAGTKLTDNARTPADYANEVDVAVAGHNTYFSPETAAGYSKGMTELASALKLDPAFTKSLTEIHLDNFATRVGMTNDENTIYGQKQEADFIAVIGDERKITDANAALTKLRGGKIDLKTVARLDGALSALSLYNVAISRRA